MPLMGRLGFCMPLRIRKKPAVISQRRSPAVRVAHRRSVIPSSASTG